MNTGINPDVEAGPVFRVSLPMIGLLSNWSLDKHLNAEIFKEI